MTEEQLKEKGYETKDEYINQIKENYKWLGYNELHILAEHYNILIIVYLADEKYRSKRWTTIYNEEKTVSDGVLFLHYKSGKIQTKTQ